MRHEPEPIAPSPPLEPARLIDLTPAATVVRMPRRDPFLRWSASSCDRSIESSTFKSHTRKKWRRSDDLSHVHANRDSSAAAAASTAFSSSGVHDCALNTVTEEDMQRTMDLFAAGCANFGLIISAAKTVVMNQPPPTAEYNAPRINVNGAQVKNVETFAYLGSTLSRNTRIDDEVAQRISKVSQAFGRLQASVWNRHGINLNTKLRCTRPSS
ncbi:unnamed protein product [Schistocephalus solidus]|uniref:Reverse transcriptase domain-containing protein n=1 Tax=Schistocephalus solidus TaxID=70667 RepID=A0A183TAT8_SCHSO|nr:unnamed protein product [Schistocephalus solidus]